MYLMKIIKFVSKYTRNSRNSVIRGINKTMNETSKQKISNDK